MQIIPVGCPCPYRIQEYVDAGISKFILRPIGANDEDLISQTRFLAEEVIPEVEGWKGP